MTIEPQALYTLLGIIIAAIAYAVRTFFASRAYREGKQADNSVIEQKSRSDATLSLAKIAETGNFFQQKMIDVVQENTRVNGENAARIQGMIVLMDDYKHVLKNLVVGFDDVSGQIPKLKSSVDQTSSKIDTLETNLINDQFGPIVDELKLIGAGITDLTTRFQRAEAYMLKTLEPLVIAQLKITTQEVVTLATPPIEDNHKESITP